MMYNNNKIFIENVVEYYLKCGRIPRGYDRYEETKRKEVEKSFVYDFLREFIFRYYNLKSGNFNDIDPIWYDIIKLFTENKRF